MAPTKARQVRYGGDRVDLQCLDPLIDIAVSDQLERAEDAGRVDQDRGRA
jgi:hypothetical protein